MMFGSPTQAQAAWVGFPSLRYPAFPEGPLSSRQNPMAAVTAALSPPVKV